MRKLGGTVEADRDMSQLRENLQVTSGAAAQVEYGVWCGRLDMRQQRLDVLADIVRARPRPKVCGTLVIVIQREVADLRQVLCAEFVG